MKFYVMDHTGHSTLEFSKSQVKEAMEKFNELVKGEKKVAAVKEGEGKSRLIRSFDPNAEEVVFHSPMAGG